MLKTRFSKRIRRRICTRVRKGNASVNVSYTYDANGAMLKDGLRSYEFDAANRLADVTTGSGIDAPTTRYVHNALGQRLFKTEPLYAPVSTGSNPTDPGVIQVLVNFFASLWGGSTTTAAPSTSEKLGYQYYYDEDGNLLYELGAGGAQSTGNAHYIYLPTPSGPMPIATVINAKQYAVHTDHLNTPRRLTQSDKRIAWQWAFSAFGDEQPTTGKNRYVDPVTTPNAGSTTIADVTFNLRYPGQYFDKESGLSYNYFRSYDAKTGRYTQSDPIGLDGGWNKYGYAEGNPMSYVDPKGESVTFVGALAIGAVAYGAYKTYTKYEKFTGDVRSCEAQCDVASCGDPERTALLQSNQARCISACKGKTLLEDFFGVGKGPTGPKSPTTTPNIFKP
jgi:RHS repeat-associated protein